MSGVRKYQSFTTNERSIGGGGSTQVSTLTFEAPEDCTVVGVIVEIAFSMEALEPTLGYEHANVGGIARLVVNRAGNVLPTPVANADWDAVGGAGELNDADSGDTWVMAPFAMSSSGTNSQPGHGTNMKVMLVPKTKRKLRRQDQVLVALFYTNAGADEGVIQEICTGTIFVTT